MQSRRHSCNLYGTLHEWQQTLQGMVALSPEHVDQSMHWSIYTAVTPASPARLLWVAI